MFTQLFPVLHGIVTVTNLCCTKCNVLFLSFGPFHDTAARWWPSWTAVGYIPRGSSWPIHPVIHNASGPSEARPACETSLPRRHCHPTSPRPTEQGRFRWATYTFGCRPLLCPICQLPACNYFLLSRPLHGSLTCIEGYVLFQLNCDKTVLPPAGAEDSGMSADSDVSLSSEGS